MWLTFPLAPVAFSFQIHPVPTEPITTTGEVVKIFSERAYHVVLPNGKLVIAHPSRAMAGRITKIIPQARVALEMTPFDFEKARIADVLPV